MDWLTFIVQVFATVGTVAAAWLALRGKLADIAKSSTAAHTDAAAARTDAKAARTAAENTESSINNRPSPASDRWDAIHKDIRAIAANQKETARDVRGLPRNSAADPPYRGPAPGRGPPRQARDGAAPRRPDRPRRKDSPLAADTT